MSLWRRRRHCQDHEDDKIEELGSGGNNAENEKEQVKRLWSGIGRRCVMLLAIYEAGYLRCKARQRWATSDSRRRSLGGSRPEVGDGNGQYREDKEITDVLTTS